MLLTCRCVHHSGSGRRCCVRGTLQVQLPSTISLSYLQCHRFGQSRSGQTSARVRCDAFWPAARRRACCLDASHRAPCPIGVASARLAKRLDACTMLQVDYTPSNAARMKCLPTRTFMKASSGVRGTCTSKGSQNTGKRGKHRYLRC